MRVKLVPKSYKMGKRIMCVSEPCLPQAPSTEPSEAAAPVETLKSQGSPPSAVQAQSRTSVSFSRFSISNDSNGQGEPEHKGAEPPLDEEERMGFLCKLGILDTVRAESSMIL